MIAKPQSPWISRPASQPHGGVKVFCFPYAGAGASAMSQLAREAGGGKLDLLLVQLPGRETRIAEPLLKSVQTAVPALLNGLEPCFGDTPFAFFGHSMGTLLAFELTRELRRRGKPEPIHLFMSGSEAPQSRSHLDALHQLPDDQFVEAIVKRYNSLPKAVLEHRELLELVLPALKGDFELLGSYRYVDEAPLACGITVFGGRQDALVEPGKLEEWRGHTTGGYLCHLFDGGHFFLHERRKEILHVMETTLEPLIKGLH